MTTSEFDGTQVGTDGHRYPVGDERLDDAPPEPGLAGRVAALEAAAADNAPGEWHVVGGDGEPDYDNGAGSVRFRREGDLVRVTGRASSFAPYDTLFTLPEGFRPTSPDATVIVLPGPGQTPTTDQSYAWFRPDGGVEMGDFNEVFFEGVTFVAPLD